MSSVAVIITLLQTALALLTFVQGHPELPRSVRVNAAQVAQQAITQATAQLSSGGGTMAPLGDAALTPRISFTAWPTSGRAPLRVSFTANGGPYSINFGDGTGTGLCINGGGGECSVRANVNGNDSIVASHTYVSNGTYTVTLYNSLGMEVVGTETIIVGGSSWAPPR